MSKLDNLTDFLASHADKIRAKLGTTAKINPQDFDSKVDEVYDAGYGKAEGEIAELEAEVKALTEQKKQLEAEKQDLQNQVDDIYGHYLEKVEEIERLNAQITEKQSQIDSLNARISELEAELPIKYNEGYADGVKSEYDRFWDDFQQNGERTDYTGAFGAQWTTETFKPKYPIRPTIAIFMFYHNTGAGLKIKDFVTFCEENNVVLDYSRCANANYGIGCLFSEHFGTLDFSKATSLQYLFYGHQWTGASGYSVVTIDEFISSETTTYHSTTFQGATKLVNLNMTGVIAKNNYDVSYCPKLSHDSLMSIINCLQDKTGDTSGTTWKVTLGTTNKAKLTDAELQIAYGKNWAVA